MEVIRCAGFCGERIINDFDKYKCDHCQEYYCSTDCRAEHDQELHIEELETEIADLKEEKLKLKKTIQILHVKNTRLNECIESIKSIKEQHELLKARVNMAENEIKLTDFKVLKTILAKSQIVSNLHSLNYSTGCCGGVRVLRCMKTGINTICPDSKRLNNEDCRFIDKNGVNAYMDLKKNRDQIYGIKK
jgi:predicted RNase H-like nuclease (RuvC/YqgF family)